MIRTYRFRIYPDNTQIHTLESSLNLSCELYNAMLQQRIYAYRSKKKVNYRSQQNEIPDIKKMFPEYKNLHSLVIQDVARRLDKAFDNFFMRVEEKRNGKNIKAGFPRFKSRDRYSSITYTQSGFRILDNGHVWLSKIGEIRMFMHRSITGDIRTLSVKRDRVGDWFITVTAENEKAKDKAVETESATIQNILSEPITPVGTDLGLKSIITTSDDIHIEPPKYLRRMERRLKNAQRQLSKKKKGSVKWNKARKKVAKINRKIERQRDDFSHKTSN
ncbi:MAG: RNA-guided endonuclease InsQ/TnpB family protein, partial [Thermoplasmataceae archaeon]